MLPTSENAYLLGTWVNRRYDARSVDDPGYTDTVREDFDRIADLSEAERVGPEGGHGASTSEVPLNTSMSTPLCSQLSIKPSLRYTRATVPSKSGVATATWWTPSPFSARKRA